MGTAQQGSGPAALALSITVVSTLESPFEGVAGEDFPQESPAGQINLVGTATGGDGSYSFAWSVAEQGDNNNINSGNVILSSAGTQNAAQYNDAVIRALDAGLTSGDVVEAAYTFTCTVTDGTGATAQASEPVRATLVAI